MVTRKESSIPGRKVVSATSKARVLQLKVAFEGKPDKEIQPTAYAFKRDGTFVTRALLKDGLVQLNITETGGLRVFIGPSIEGKRLPTLDLMERLHAYEPNFILDPKKNIHELLPIPEIDWKCWLWCSCRVRGRVVKPVTISGVTTDMPVCHARVHICEVDPLWLLIRRVPDPIIIKIREYLRVWTPFPPPPELEPEPIFEFDPSIFEASAKNIALMNKATIAAPMPQGSGMERIMLNPQPLPPKANLTVQKLGIGSKIERVAFNPQPEPPAKSMLDMLPVPTQAALSSSSTPMVRDTLLANLELIRPFICRWPWIWPYFYTCDELAVLETDSNGRFDTTIFYPCFGDHPDLYFWVEFCIGGVWTTVYHPPVRCNTYWNYACGSEVTIRVTDPRVPWCGEPPSLPGLQVGVMLIGHNVSLHEIQGQVAGANEGMTTDGRPFGGSLEPVVWFGQDDLIAAGITHYKWSYSRLGANDWHAMDRQVVRHYAEINPVFPFNLTFKPFLLGPDPLLPGQNLFKIQPKDPPAGAYGWAPQIDARENSASSFFLSYLLNGGNAAAAAGKYELKLELFNSAGNLVNMTDAGILLKVPDVDGPFGIGTVTTVPPAAEHLILDGAGKTVAFRLVLHVDNNPCEALINETSVNGVMAGPCGFISYPPGADAHISFKARNPNNFATFSFRTYRGSTGSLAVASASGSVGSSPLNGFVRNAASVFSKDIPVAALVGLCPGGKAAFSENLWVDAIATDGWSILEYLDAGATPKAFALEPGS